TANRWWGVRRFFGEASPGAPADVRVLSRPKPQHFTVGTQITITRTVREDVNSQRNQSPQIVFAVALSDPAFPVGEDTNELAARHLAEEVAGFLSLAILDTSSGTPVLREAGSIGQPLRERAARANLSAPLPPAPENMRSSYRVEEGRLIFTAPREP